MGDQSNDKEMKVADIINAYVKIKTTNNTIPDDVLDFMKDCAIVALEMQGIPTHQEIGDFAKSREPIEWKAKLIADGAKWMGYRTALRIKCLEASIIPFAPDAHPLDGEPLRILKETARRVLSDKPTTFKK